MCAASMGSRRGGRRKYPDRCNEDATCGDYCPYHARAPKVDGESRLKPHRDFVMGLPMPGFEALKELAAQVMGGQGIQ